MANAEFANARAKSLEKYLVGEDRLNRMIESSSPEEGIRVLSEINFGEGTVISSPLDFELLIDAERQKLYKFIKETGVSETLVSFLLLKNDYHNAQVFIRSKYLKTEVTDMLVPDGLIKAETMKEKIMIDDYRSFSPEMAEALKTADSEFVSGRATGRAIDGLFKKALYKELQKISAKDKILKSIFSLKADCANIATCLRARNFTVAEDMIVVGGTLKKDELKALCEESFESLKDKCRFSPLSEFLLKGIDGVSKGQPLTDFEKLADGYAVTYLKKEKYSTQGIHPLLLYVYSKLADFDNVRIVMVGLINGMDKTQIKGRLRNGYER